MTVYFYLKNTVYEYLILLMYYLRHLYLKMLVLWYRFFNKNKDLIFVKENKIIEKSNIKNFSIPKGDYCVIYKNINFKNTNIDLVKVINDFSDIKNEYRYLNQCIFNFILVILKTEEGDIDITNYLKNQNNTYYIENAEIFDKNFLNWICLKHLNKKYKKMSIYLLDHNANEIILEENQFIKLGNNNYYIDKR